MHARTHGSIDQDRNHHLPKTHSINKYHHTRWRYSCDLAKLQQQQQGCAVCAAALDQASRSCTKSIPVGCSSASTTERASSPSSWL